ncbi:MAG: hypothetical protein AYP45_03420 [Candidatus Brocadia carolinensis]|uniref:Uncharacterized protein n=1 Tax=Candidatus Brocadia carolinensis TaxID=1004156 RepID=A0A1V4AWD5_9BACT|nr:MAG: hypothetical protein AYP45_03420 [Candidatus Brocadia caroliniensis]
MYSKEKVVGFLSFKTQPILKPMPNQTRINRQINMGNGSVYNETNIYQGDGKIPHMLTKPPFVSEGFVGRKEELRAMKEKLFGGNSLLLLVNGEGG